MSMPMTAPGRRQVLVVDPNTFLAQTGRGQDDGRRAATLIQSISRGNLSRADFYE